jgi:hypothetical protein
METLKASSLQLTVASVGICELVHNKEEAYWQNGLLADWLKVI